MKPEEKERSLDPKDWDALRAVGHQMVDDILDHLQTIRERPAWQPVPESVARHFRDPIPRDPKPIVEVYEEFKSFW